MYRGIAASKGAAMREQIPAVRLVRVHNYAINFFYNNKNNNTKAIGLDIIRQLIITN